MCPIRFNHENIHFIRCESVQNFKEDRENKKSKRITENKETAWVQKERI